MKAAWYTDYGPAAEALHLGEMPDPLPGPGEVLVRVRASGINPTDVKRRAGPRPGAEMAFPQIVPHSDGAGEIIAVGAGGSAERVGQRVWLWNAQWQRAQGTAAELIALPAEQAVPLPENTSFAEGACLGIPAMTAWYALYGDGADLAGQTVLVTGGAGAVGRYACQMARLGGARVIATVSSDEKGAHSTAQEWINYRTHDVADCVMRITGGAGVDRIVEVDFGANQDVSVAALKPSGTIAAYASAGDMTPVLQFYPFLFANVTLRMLICYHLQGAARARGEAQLSEWLAIGALSHAVVRGGALDDIARAHELVESGAKLGTVVLDV